MFGFNKKKSELLPASERAAMKLIIEGNLRSLSAQHKTASALLIAFGEKKNSPKAIKMKDTIKFIEKRINAETADLIIYYSNELAAL
jgi:hypothetical protein